MAPLTTQPISTPKHDLPSPVFVLVSNLSLTLWACPYLLYFVQHLLFSHLVVPRRNLLFHQLVKFINQFCLYFLLFCHSLLFSFLLVFFQIFHLFRLDPILVDGCYLSFFGKFACHLSLYQAFIFFEHFTTPNLLQLTHLKFAHCLPVKIRGLAAFYSL